MPNPRGRPPPPPDCSLHTSRPPPYRRSLSEGIFFFLPFHFSSSWLFFFFFFFAILSPVVSLSPSPPPPAIQRSVNILKRGVAVGGGGERICAMLTLPFRVCLGPLPFGASVFYSFYVVKRPDACFAWWSSSRASTAPPSSLSFLRTVVSNSKFIQIQGA